MELKNRVTKNLQQIGQSGLWGDAMPISYDDYEALLSSSDTEQLLQILQTGGQEAIERLTLEDLMTMPFNEAKRNIDEFTLAKRIRILEDLEIRRSYLYDQVNRYGAESTKDPDRLTVNEWKIIMGKLKHLEIILAWLYGVA